MSLNLYQIKNEYLKALDELSGDDFGQIPEEAIKDTMDGLQGALSDKIANVIAYAKSLEAEKKAIDDAVSGMIERANKLSYRSASIKDYVRKTMEECGISKINHEWFQISIAKNPKMVVITNLDEVPDEFFVTKKVKRLAKTEILELLKNGHHVPGCGLVQGTRLSIK